MGNIIVGITLIVVIGLACKKVYSDAKNHKCACGGSCGKNCPSKGTCSINKR